MGVVFYAGIVDQQQDVDRFGGGEVIYVKVQYLSSYNKELWGPIKKGTIGSSGFDLRSCEAGIVPAGKWSMFKCGIRFEMQEGVEAQIRSRSGLSVKSGVFVLNSPGTIDSDYRGEICCVLASISSDDYHVKQGDRIAQVVFSKSDPVLILDVEEVTETDRGQDGFGSTGNM